MCTKYVLSAMFLVLISNPRVDAQPPQFSQVKIAASTLYGVPLDGAAVQIVSVGPQTKLAATTDISGVAIIEKVPFGLYDITVQLSGFRETRERIGLFQLNTLVHVGLGLEHTHSGERAELYGTVHMSGREPAWVRLVPVYGNTLVEGPINTNGDFYISGFEPGDYLVVVFTHDKLLVVERHSLLAKRQTVQLSPK